jgi:hypothetical protein
MMLEEVLHVTGVLVLSGLLLGLRTLFLSAHVGERRTSNGQRCKN